MNRTHGLAVREAGDVGDERLHDKRAPVGQVPRHVLEAAHLVGLTRQVKERIEHHEDQIERALHADVGKVPNRHRDGATARLLAELRDHGLRGVDTVHR
jgi:hypothetical protein